jgi:hypothetical protein
MSFKYEQLLTKGMTYHCIPDVLSFCSAYETYITVTMKTFAVCLLWTWRMMSFLFLINTWSEIGYDASYITMRSFSWRGRHCLHLTFPELTPHPKLILQICSYCLAAAVEHWPCQTYWTSCKIINCSHDHGLGTILDICTILIPPFQVLTMQTYITN